MTQHAMHYRAGSSGLGCLGIPDAAPHWWCDCRSWTFPARQTRSGGLNTAQAQKAHALHVTQARSSATG